MSYLGVGIHENVVLRSTSTINDKGTLVIDFATKTDASNMLAAFEDGSAVEAAEVSLIQWPIKITDWQGKAMSATQVGQEINNLKNTLVDILMVFMPSDKAKEALNSSVMFAGLGINADTQNTLVNKLVNVDFVTAVYNNICKAFLAAARPFMDTVTFRVKLRRTSKAKHFAIIPPKGKFFEAWIEPMTVPRDSTQIKWSEYEIKNGFNDGTKTETSDAGSDATNVNKMFQAPPAPGATPPAPSMPPVTPSVAPPAGNPFNQ